MADRRRSALGRLVDRLLHMEEINGGGVCPTYLYRWVLLRLKTFQVYLHHFVGDDWSTDLHDHPKRFISLGLWGSYIEVTEALGHPFKPAKPGTHLAAFGKCAAEVPAAYCCRPEAAHQHERRYTAPWLRTFPADHRHRLRLDGRRSCWTIVVVLRHVRPWGFWPGGRFVPWRQYVRSEEANKAKSCPD
jgi:hypothetical protein